MTELDNMQTVEQALKPVPANQLVNYEGQIQMAQMIAKASVMPAHLRGNPGNCLAVITIAQTWNMNPILVGLKTSVITKRGGGETLMFEGQLVHAAINNSKLIQGRLKLRLSGQKEQTKCVVSGRVAGEDEDSEMTVDMPTIKNSPLWSGTQTEKEQQLSYLAARMWCRRFTPEILMGVYTPDDDFSREQKQTVDTTSLDDDLPPAENPEPPRPVIDAELTLEEEPKPPCGICEGTGMEETADGKGPCPACAGADQTQTEGT